MFPNLDLGKAAPTTSVECGTTTANTANTFGTGQALGSSSTSSRGQPVNTSLFPSCQAQPNNLFQNKGTGFETPASTTSTVSGCVTTTANEANTLKTGQLFSKPASASGSPSASAFGQPVKESLSPSSQTQPNNLFQNAGTGFGTPTIFGCVTTTANTANKFGTGQALGSSSKSVPTTSTVSGCVTTTANTTNTLKTGQLFSKPASASGSPSTFAFGQPVKESLSPLSQTQPNILIQSAGTGFVTPTIFGCVTTTANTANTFGTGQALGSSSTSLGGQPVNTSLFPSSQAQPNNLFQNKGTGFETPASTTSTVSGTKTIFGNQQPATGGIFSTSCTFGVPKKTTGFETQPAQPTIFGQQAGQPQTSNIFQPAANNLFGTSTAFRQQATRTRCAKFEPVTGTDTTLESGVSNSSNTKLHSITCMKDYENKSFEELRYEDYMANRNGTKTIFGKEQPATGGIFSTSCTFGVPNKTAGFGTQPAQPTLFGQQAQTANIFQYSTRDVFGTSSAFGQQTTGTGGVKFKPVTHTNVYGENSISVTTYPKFQSITCMKEYENKSFEELRYEDYMANRKGTTSIFGQQQPTMSGIFETSHIFGQPNKATVCGPGTLPEQPNPFCQQAAEPQRSSMFSTSAGSIFGMSNAVKECYETTTKTESVSSGLKQAPPLVSVSKSKQKDSFPFCSPTSTQFSNSCPTGRPFTFGAKLPTSGYKSSQLGQQRSIGDSQENSIYGSVNNVSNLLCAQCNKVLSRFPVYCYVKGFSCGRCPYPENGIRNKIFEELAKHILFPCCYREHGCQMCLFPDNMQEHEISCKFKKYRCPMNLTPACEWKGFLKDLLYHFSQQHKSYIRHNHLFEVRFDKNIEENYILPHGKALYLASCSTNLEKYVFSCKVSYMGHNPYERDLSYKLILKNARKSSSYEIQNNINIATQIEKDVLRNVLKTTSSLVAKIEFLRSAKVPKSSTDAEELNSFINKDILRELECLVCLEYMTPPIHQCLTGHSICFKCKELIKTCPVCKNEFQNTQNFALAQIIQYIDYPCRNNGCNFVGKVKDTIEHELTCIYSPTNSPLKEYSNCPREIQFDSICDHIIKNEKLLEINFVSKEDPRKNVVKTFIVLYETKLFKLLSLYKNNKLYFTAQLIEPSDESLKYRFEINIVDNEQTSVARKTKPCGPVTKSDTAFDNDKLVIVFSRDQIGQLIGNQIFFKVTIFKS